MTRLAASVALGAALLPLHAAEVKRPSPPLTINLAPSGQIQLDNFKGKVVLLEFLSTTCPHCQNASQIMERLYKEYGPRGFQPVGAAFNEMSHMLVADYVKQFKLSYPVGYVSRDTVMQYLKRSPMLRMSVPQLVFVDRNGVIRQHIDSTVNEQFFMDEEKNMRTVIEALLKESAEAPKPAAKKKTTAKKSS